MDPDRSRKRLLELIASSGGSLEALTPRAGLDMMLRIYEEDPAEGFLCCSWGTVTRYGPMELGFTWTRWFVSVPDGMTVDELSLLFKVGPPDVAGDFPAGMEWNIPGWMEGSDIREHLADIRSRIESSPAFRAWGQSPAAGVALVHGDLISRAYELFDCWGARDPSRPIVHMTEEQWLQTDDVALMLRWFRQEWPGEEAELDRLIQRYLVACCRGIWRLLPQDASRTGVEVTERFIEGSASREEFADAEWMAEGAAFRFDFQSDPDSIARWCEEIASIPGEELAAMIHSPRPEDDLSPLELLRHAAYFVDSAMCYPGLKPRESIESYRIFLSAPLLREVVGNPFRARPDSPGDRGV